jgi:hypothetical protein
MTPGARNLEYVTSTGETLITYGRYFGSEFITLPNGAWQGNFINTPENDLACAYNPDLDAFYINDRSSDILLIDRETGNLISSFICRTHGNYYDFAYDNWSEGGPYLWGFSGDGENGCTIVQISLPDGMETGFTYDASWLSPGGNAVPGGLFIMQDLIPGTVSLCGILQGEVMFGLELGPAEWDFFLGGYNVYMNETLYNGDLITDTTYLIPNLDPGTYSFEVSAVYQDSIGDILCESMKEGPAEVTVPENVFLLGGNILADTYKLDAGIVNLYSFENGEIVDHYDTEINDLGYFLFPQMSPGNYMMHAIPDNTSSFFNTHVPTYWGGKIHWEDVSPQYFEDNAYNNDINLIEMAVLSPGAGKISGQLLEQDPGREIPLQDAQVMLLNVMNECIAIDYINSYGQFAFDNLAYGTYKVLVEITGKSMNPVICILSESNPEKTDINLYVMSDEIVMGIDEDLPSWIGFLGDPYPNPAEDNVTFSIHTQNPTEVMVKIFNLNGQIVIQEIHPLKKGPDKLLINLNDLHAGVYYIALEFGEEYTATRKLVIIE